MKSPSNTDILFQLVSALFEAPFAEVPEAI